MKDDDQLGLFAGDTSPLIEPHVEEEDRALAARVPSFIRFGSSSWSFPGWAGIVWKGTPSETDLAQRGLAAYAQHPLLRTVGMDRTHYRPLRDEDLAEYKAQVDEAKTLAPGLPPFRVVSKIWDEVTTAVFPSHPRYGARAGARNPAFLDAETFRRDVLAPYRRAGATGPFVFELTPMPSGTFDERAFVARVDAFIATLPAGHRFAFELRNPELFGTRWLDMLRANGVAHVFNYWTAMPSLRLQLRAGSPTASFVVVRLMLPPYTRYAQRKAELAPFDRVVEPQEEMREDVVAILHAASEAGCGEAFVLVSNTAEGCSPLTIRELARRTARVFRR
ncbi:MAG: DUF72 domain-containing protein [Labilithrix sp.]|nr:DUF72 domain-containing protein [Labilithrix sp.]MCW5812940.1 DUF72 domain-containing protein [Labilithrix sp.]